ncbi:MAG: integrase domain-containing protein [Betaproteobacteria bacterium]|nr:integrase domain-containing protein [Betaproteobacteria bacterium]
MFDRQHRQHRHTSRRRLQEPSSPGRSTKQEPARRQSWAGKSPEEVLARYKPGKTPPLTVLNVLIELFNTLHTSLEKTVSHKTRQERAQFLRRFLRDLKHKGGFKMVPDPRNLGQKHIHAMVQVWRGEHLAPATIQTYLSFLRGLAMWMGKPGFVRGPDHYGLSLEEYQRHGAALRDKSWSAQGIATDEVLARICAYDPRVGASLRLMQAFGLRRKESVQFRPFQYVKPFGETGLPMDRQQANRYVWTKGKGGRTRWVPLVTPVQHAALEYAQQVVGSSDAHMGLPDRDLKRNLRRLDYVLEKFGITKRARGATGHGLRHERFGDEYEDMTGVPPPIRGGGPVPPELDRAARLAVSQLAGHSRVRASAAYLGAVRKWPAPAPASSKSGTRSRPDDGDATPVAG